MESVRAPAVAGLSGTDVVAVPRRARLTRDVPCREVSQWGTTAVWGVPGLLVPTRNGRLARLRRWLGESVVRRTDEAAFREYVEGTRLRHYRLALLLCGNEHDAEDLVQHALIQLYTRWQRVCRRGNPDAYIRKIISNKLVDMHRSAYQRHEERTPDVPDGLAERELIDQLVVDRAHLRDALAQLPPFGRTVLILRWYEELSVEETAEVLECSPSKVKRSTSAALLAMRDLLREGK